MKELKKEVKDKLDKIDDLQDKIDFLIEALIIQTSFKEHYRNELIKAGLRKWVNTD